MLYEPIHQGIVIIDIEQFGRADRTNLIRAHMSDAMRRMFGEGLRRASISESERVLKTQGDGLLALFAPHVRKSRLVHPLVPHLVAGWRPACGGKAVGRGLPMTACYAAGVTRWSTTSSSSCDGWWSWRRSCCNSRTAAGVMTTPRQPLGGAVQDRPDQPQAACSPGNRPISLTLRRVSLS